MNENQICKEITTLHDNIYAAGIIDKQKLRARYSKMLENWDPNDERIQSMLAQPEVLLNISKTNEYFLGPLKYIIVCYEYSDYIYFPATIDNTSKIFYIRVKPTLRGEEMIKQVYDYLKVKEESTTNLDDL